MHPGHWYRACCCRLPPAISCHLVGSVYSFLCRIVLQDHRRLFLRVSDINFTFIMEAAHESNYLSLLWAIIVSLWKAKSIDMAPLPFTVSSSGGSSDLFLHTAPRSVILSFFRFWMSSRLVKKLSQVTFLPEPARLWHNSCTTRWPWLVSLAVSLLQSSIHLYTIDIILFAVAELYSILCTFAW